MVRHELLAQETIKAHNRALHRDAVHEDYEALGRSLNGGGGLSTSNKVKRRVGAFTVAVPSLGAGIGGTRFAKFPIPGEPTNIHEKLEDCAVVNQLCRMTPRVSPHFPWIKRRTITDGLREEASNFGLGFDAVNSNTFQDRPGQTLSLSLWSADDADDNPCASRRSTHKSNVSTPARSSVQKRSRCGSRTAPIFPASRACASRSTGISKACRIYAALPPDWRLLIEHKLYEPAFYSTVVSDWGTTVLCASNWARKRNAWSTSAIMRRT